MTDEQILEAAKLINTKRKLSEYHKGLYRKVVGLVNDTDPDVSLKLLRIREHSSFTIQTIKETTGYMSSVELSLNSDLAKELLDSLECILSKKEQLL